MELQEEIDDSTTITGDFNTARPEMDRFIRQIMSKDIAELNSIIHQPDISITDIYRILHPTILEHIFKFTENIHNDRAHSGL